MFALSRILAACATAFAVLALTTEDGSARAFQPPSAQDDIEEVVKLLGQKKVDRAALARQVAAIQKKHGLDDLMTIYKPTAKKGLGWNPAKKGPGDGIEKHLIDLGTKKELSKADLAKEKALIARAAHYNLALAEITEAFVPAKWAGGKLAAEWRGRNAEVKGGSAESLAAVEANDPAALKKAMTRISAGCYGCHALFRPLEGDLTALVELLRGKKVDRVEVDALVGIMKEKHDDLNDLMAKVYKPTRSKGIGWNPAKQWQSDGIEKRLIDLGKKELTQAQLQAEKELLLRAAYYNLAMVEIAKAYVPPKRVRPWNRHNSEVGDGTKDMIDAVKADDPKALKKAMGKIVAGCNGCHTDFRK